MSKKFLLLMPLFITTTTFVYPENLSTTKVSIQQIRFKEQAKQNYTTTVVNKLILPPRLKFGDTISIVASASNITHLNEIPEIKRRFESMGFKVILGKNIYASAPLPIGATKLSESNPNIKEDLDHSYIQYAGTPKERADDLMDMFKNQKVKAIIELRGGYGSAQILDLLDYDIIKQNPKILIGFSDITSLLLAINLQTGLVTFHGPVAVMDWNDFSYNYFKWLVMDGAYPLVLNKYIPALDDDGNISNLNFTITSGRAEGRLIGGNLTLLMNLLGTKYQPDFNHAILFVEDADEKDLYRIDRMLGQLKNSGALNKISGFIFASCSNCNLTSLGYSTLMKTFKEYIKPLKIPAFAGTMVGHFGSNYTLPIGSQVKIDADSGSMTIQNRVVQ
ncbi:MAG: peptidase LD-carboxypeptidase [Burkholderiales bacterium]|jgi:muramoyltetrapeptide carboxypeptidase|nr:peptidase LD-carboxypeptidase [Burkholderiales bacterium]